MDQKLLELTMRLTPKGLRFSKRPYIIRKENAGSYAVTEVSFEASPLTRRIMKKTMNVVEATRMFFPNLTYKAICLEADEIKYSRELVAMVEKDVEIATAMFKKCDEDLKKLLKDSKK